MRTYWTKSRSSGRHPSLHLLYLYLPHPLCALHDNGDIFRLVKVVSIPKAESLVLDIAYIVGTLLFFALMLAYVRGCAALGKRSPGDVAVEDRVP